MDLDLSRREDVPQVVYDEMTMFKQEIRKHFNSSILKVERHNEDKQRVRRAIQDTIQEEKEHCRTPLG